MDELEVQRENDGLSCFRFALISGFFHTPHFSSPPRWVFSYYCQGPEGFKVHFQAVLIGFACTRQKNKTNLFWTLWKHHEALISKEWHSNGIRYLFAPHGKLFCCIKQSIFCWQGMNYSWWEWKALYYPRQTTGLNFQFQEYIIG